MSEGERDVQSKRERKEGRGEEGVKDTEALHIRDSAGQCILSLIEKRRGDSMAGNMKAGRFEDWDVRTWRMNSPGGGDCMCAQSSSKIRSPRTESSAWHESLMGSCSRATSSHCLSFDTHGWQSWNTTR